MTLATDLVTRIAVCADVVAVCIMVVLMGAHGVWPK